MAVLVEALSVVTQRDSIERKVTGGLKAYMRLVPNQTLCMDDHLVAVSLLSPDDVSRFVNVLTLHGLTHLKNEKALDISVVDMHQGPIATTDWLEFLPRDKQRKVSCCWFFDGPRDRGYGTYLPGRSLEIATPDGWTYENSITAHHKYVPGPEEAVREAAKASQSGNHKVAIDLLLSAIEQGSIDAQVYLGAMYCNGEGVERDMKTGKLWFQKAAGHGHALGKEYLKRLLDSGY